MSRTLGILDFTLYSIKYYIMFSGLLFLYYVFHLELTLVLYRCTNFMYSQENKPVYILNAIRFSVLIKVINHMIS